MKKFKIYLSLSLFWIILVGYLVWANGLLNRGSKNFIWDEWIWFGLVPALTPYLFLYIWKPEVIKNIFNNNHTDSQ
mgnify:FL=1|jgi:hypothetical protein|tara:strand:- start:1977 stop:2204 length:228 start_codon:yes stop_codon:yes gene_type:complete